MRVVISGSSGLIGTALRRQLTDEGHDVVRLVRRLPAEGEARWNPEAGTLDAGALDGADAVINLSGAGIGDKRWTEDRRRVVYESRIGTTRLLAQTIASLSVRPTVFISGSAIGIYGDRDDEVLTEASAPGPADDFLVDLVIDWEAATDPAHEAGVRTVNVRSGIVLDRDEGALGKLMLPAKLGVGGRLGSGRQWWSWISLVDEVRALSHLLGSSLSGAVNVTAPNPATNAELTKALGWALHRPTVLPVPRFALQILLGKERAGALGFTSARVLPERLLADGFTFVHETIGLAMAALVGAD